jgi:hypothetical protein
MCRSKYLVTLLVSVLVVSSIMVTELASAQAKPSVPTFSITFTDASYYNGSQYLKAGTAEIIINNQPFIPSNDNNGPDIKLYYNLRCKGHDDTRWINYPGVGYIVASNSDKTTIQYNINESWASYNYFDKPYIPDDGRLDFQVQAFIGYCYPVISGNIMQQQNFLTYVYYGQTSGWSNTQTITVGQGNTQSTPNPTINPIQPNPTKAIPTQKTAPTQQITEIHLIFGELNWEQTAIILLSIAVIGLTVGLLVLYRKTQKISANKTI